MPEFWIPWAVEVVSWWWRLTPEVVRDIIEDGIDAAGVEPYEEV